MYPIRRWNLDIAKKNYFWINYKSIRSDTVSGIKNQIFVVYNDGNLVDYGFLDLLKNARTISFCNVIFAISESENDAVKTREAIENYFFENKFGTNYIVFCIDKTIAQRIFDSNNKMKSLDEIMLEQSTLL